MKNLYAIVISLLLTTSILAQSPEKMSYQAVIRNSSDELVTNQTVGMQISILQGTADGTPVYIETQTPTTNANGLVSIEIGGNNATVVSGDFTTIDWANSIYFLKTETDPTGGTSYTIKGTSQLLSVPYALHAKTAESITGTITETDPEFTNWDKSYNDLTNIPNILDSINTVIDTTTKFVRTELDGDATNEIQTISRTGLTVTLSNEGGSYQDSVNTQNLVSVLTQSNDGGAIQIKNIADPTDAQDVATKIYVDLLEAKLNMLSNTLEAGGKVTDFDGNSYNIVKIGTQIWMAENLKTTHYANGDIIPDGTGVGDITGETDPEYWFANNDDLSKVTTYGRLYTWYTVIDSRNVCPTGWHVPTDSEWTALSEYLGGEDVSAGKLKEIGTIHWVAPNTGATNETGFTALPGGSRVNDGTFYNVGYDATFWSATEYDVSLGRFYDLNTNGAYIIRAIDDKDTGFSVRCIKD